MLKKIIILSLFWLTPLVVQATGGSLILKDSQESYGLGTTLYILKDPKGNLTINDVNNESWSQKFKKSSKNVPNFGQTTDVYWVRLKVKNHSKIKDWYLTYGYYLMDEITLFRKTGDSWTKSITGDLYKNDSKEVKSSNFVFLLKIPKKETVYFLRFKTLGTLSIPLELNSPRKFNSKDKVQALIDGLYYGSIGIISVYNLFIYFSTFNPSYMAYVFYMLFMMLVTAGNTGFGLNTLYPNYPWFNNQGLCIFAFSSMFFLTHFTSKFLKIKMTFPKFSKVMALFQGFTFLLVLMGFFASDTYVLNRFVILVVLTGMLLSLFAGIRSIIFGNRAARFFITAFSFYIIGAILKVLSLRGILPSNVFLDRGYIIGHIFEAALLSLGLADVINALRKEAINKAEKLNIAKNELADLNKNLENKVLERTEDLNFALKQVENLLNNMRQAVFTADQKGLILNPVSIFSEKIFEGKIQNKKLNETLFKNINKKSELYSTIQFSYTHIFGADDLQWEMLKDHFPRRIIHKNPDESEKILNVTYTPLWDENDLLDRVMFIVEDITEIDTLEKEMEEQKLVSLKNIQILQELASNKKVDLNSFFSKTNQMCLDALYLAKKMRSQIDRSQDLDELHLFFRHLHTIKGNARVFNLGFISSCSHQIESDLMAIIDKSDKNELIKWEEMNNLVQGMYELQGQINEYLKAAKSVFSLEFNEDKKFKEKLHDQVKNLEHWSSQLCLICAKDPSKEITALEENIQNKEPYKDKVIEELKTIGHSLKGLSRGMDEREISEEVHFFEGGLSLFDDSKENLDLEKFNECIINPLNHVKDLSFNIFLGAKQFKTYETSPEKWSFILAEVYEINLLIQKKELEVLFQRIYNIHATMTSLGLEFLPGIFRLIYSIIEEKGIDSKITSYLLKNTWEYLIFFCSLDNNHTYSSEERSNIIKKLDELQENPSWDFLEKESIFIHFLKRIKEKGHHYRDVFSTIGDLLKTDYKNLISNFVPRKDYTKASTDLFYELKKSFNLTSVEAIERLHKKNDDFFFNFKEWFCQEDHLGINHYLKKIDLIQTLNTFCITIDSREKWLKPRTYDVLIENYNQCFEHLLKYIENGQKIDLDTINHTFEKLIHLPIKHSFYKFSSIVDDISKTLGKKINFRVSGDQGGLEKERLGLLQDAMVHLVRNSIDHGIEIPSQRISKGKDEMGTIEINCHHSNTEIFQIKLKDDGGGIDIHKVVQKGLEKGLVNPEELKKMNDKEKINLIFLPNFSTKEDVSEISGRGVGMDVVKKNLGNLGASLDIKTIKGEGTEFIININLVK